MGLYKLHKKKGNVEAASSKPGLQLVLGNCYLFKKYLSYSVIHYVFHFLSLVRFWAIGGLNVCVCLNFCYNGIFSKNFVFNCRNNASAITVVSKSVSQTPVGSPDSQSPAGLNYFSDNSKALFDVLTFPEISGR